MMHRTLVAALAATLLSGSVALGADLGTRPVYKAPPVVAPVPIFTWTGCYLGGHAGYAWSRDSFTFTNNAGVVEDFSFSPSSFIGGGQVGCNYQFAPNWVLGIEGTWSGTDLHQANVSVIIPPRLRGIKIDEIATVTGRLGYAWDRLMLYGKGGWADLRVDTISINPLDGVTGNTSGWDGGWTVGGGLEYAPWQNIVLGVEFDYVRANFSRSGMFSNGDVPLLVTNGRANIYTFMARASYLFNWGKGKAPVVARY
jgi:outer membrane immunogenic protein